MKKRLLMLVTKRKFAIAHLLVALLLSISARTQLPTAQTIASQMKVGWNLGNTLEAICGETVWGGATTTQQLINTVKASGFNTIRLPVSWDCHATNGVIDPNWMARVKQVVDYCMNQNLYVIINIHWDNGWLENNVTTSAQASVNAKQQNYWTQIGNYFKNYNERLLFASANEPNATDATGMSVLLSYHQTFINAVRATGGNNSSRTLIIQGPQTNIDLTNNLMNTMPTDQIANRLMVEVHYYTPWQFCGLTEDASWGSMFYYWGNGYHSTTDASRNATWGEESEVERGLGLMKSKFIDKGIPVIIGEYAAVKRNLSAPSDQSLHVASRLYFYKYLVNSARSKGIIPICWDINMQMYNRSTSAVLDQPVIDAIMQGAGISTGSYVTLTNRATGLLIDGMYRSSNGSNAGQYSSSGSDAQKWVLEPAGSYVKIKNKATGIYLDGMGRTANGSICGQWATSSSNNQQWLQVAAGSYMKFQNRATGLYLDGLGATTNGADLGQWQNSSSNNQQWAVTTLANGRRDVSMPVVSSPDESMAALALNPNPFTTNFKLTIPDPGKVLRIAIFDIMGRQVETIEQAAILNSLSLGASLKSGVYVVKVYGVNEVRSFKVIKK
ncbi:cellulase family glycosylhydrolase [Niastella vici]|uniref:cellulase family glycosylhydrolase n=1 Tax=Niastella vici TaxID=1703345 RepID=UPI00117CE53D|nr:cellulase family glycosylhydrolase [Niastella vici]